jgi:4-alpha-glucanotransferase
VPEWLKKGIMYQIYVDRFFNGNPKQEILNPKKGSLLHGDWYDTPFYLKDEKGRVLRWTFFGGNLLGVIEKLPYLEELGISIIYFNPIFEAASNHKYDTGNYLKIDPMYGDNETFARLVQEAEKYGIAIILDGVFSHTGSDSIYFNKYGNYPGLGAFQSEDSPYYPWYKFKDCQGEYECWWGVDDLPNVNELEPSYTEFIFGGKNSVIRHWMGKGVKGWRLDVIDELPDEFVKELRQAVKKADPQAVLIGEVWEDASRKVSYGKQREYFWGEELDSVMNYPLRKILLDYILGRINAEISYKKLMSLFENYPRENFLAAMNILGSHDRARVLTLLGEAPAEESLTEVGKENYRLPAEARNKAVQRLKLLVLVQMTLPGAPCVYYGDEVGVEGFSDPYNRGTYPWGKEDQEILKWYKKLIRLRREYHFLNEGEFSPFYYGTEILGYRLQSPSEDRDEEIIVGINRNSLEDSQLELTIRGKGKTLSEDTAIGDSDSILVLDLLKGERLQADYDSKGLVRSISLNLKPLEGKILYISVSKEIFTTKLRDRSCGILLHLTSLPSSWGIGDMGNGAKKFIDFLAASKQKLWQILPLNPLGIGYSPYQSSSIFAGNTLLISLDALQEEGLLTKEEVQEGLISFALENEESDPVKVDYQLVGEIKARLLLKAFLRFRIWMNKEKTGLLRKNGGGKYLSYLRYLKFLEENEFWLEDYCLYTVLKGQRKGLAWYEWEKPFALREARALNSLRGEFKEGLDYHRFLQYTFFHQWQKLKRYAQSQGIKIIGDLPIYVAGDSCDTWVNKEFFKLDSEGKPTAVAGVPPDYFSATGQLWENPLYDWRKMEEDGYSWWKERVRQVLKIYDYVRLDHFRGFEAYWEIPAGQDNAINGRWLKGPGKKFFEVLRKEFGELPFIAEDLGFLTPEVHNLRNILGFPGMRVYQFEAASLKNGKNGEEELMDTIYYSGTHDNDTLFGWYLNNQKKNSSRKHTLNKILERIYQSSAPWVIIPLQDILGLGSEARMNTPGTIGGNWMWRMQEQDLTEGKKEWLKDMTVKSGRGV